MSKNKFWGKPLPNKIEGGLADNKNRSDFDPKSLKEGKQVELEHTKDPEIAEEIASDHLTEDKNYYKKLKTIEKNDETDLQKMSQPTLRFPNIKELPTRPDQEVKSIDRNKVYQVPIKDEAYKEVMGVDHKFVDQQGLENKKLANKLYNKVTEPDLSPSQRHLSRRNWEERLHQSTKNTGTRGGYTFKDSKTSTSLPYVYEDKYANTDFIKEHEAAHHLLNKLSDHPQFGENHRIALVDKLVSMLHPDDYNAIHSNLTINNRYNPNSQKFNEEVLNHIRDFLVSRYTRETHDEFVKENFPRSYKPIDYNRLKRSWKDITKYAKMLTPAQLKALAEGNGDNMGSNIAAREGLEKNLKSFAVGLGMLGSLSSHAPILNVSNEAPTEEVQPDNSFGTQPEDHFLHNVMQVETSGGKNLNHPLITYGMHKGHKAIGKYALMPLTIKEIAKRHVIGGGDDQELHELATSSPDKITKKVKTNPDLELKVARALARHVIERHGDNTPNAAFAWKYGHNLKSKNIDKTKRDSDIYIQKFKKLVAGNETMGLKPYRSVASVEKNENDLNKMSQPSLKFPKLGIENRQEENVQIIDQPRQKELFARKAVQEWANSPESKKYSKKVMDRSRPKEVKRIAAGFDKSRMGVNIGAHAATLGGKEISRYEDGGDAFQQKFKEHFDKKNSMIKEYNQKVIDWRNKASKFTQEHLDTPEGKQAWMEHLKNKPEKPKLPRAPAKPKRDASKITDSEKIARGSKIDMIKEHEALHRTLGLIDKKHGYGTRKKISHNLLSQFRSDTVNALWSWVAGRGYKESSPHFTEELLTHARDVLSNPEQRGYFKKFLLRQGKSQEDIDNHIKHLKIGWKKANNYAKHLTIDMLKNEEIDLIKAPVIMDEDTSESIGEGSIASPYQNDSYMTTNQLNNGLYHHVFNNSGYSKHFLSSSPDPKETEGYLAHIGGTHFYNGENAKGLKVGYSKVNKQHKGKGYGKMLYLSALAHHGDMESDENLTSRSNKVWQDLSKLGQGHIQVDLAQTQDIGDNNGFDELDPAAALSYHKAKANKEGLRQMLFKQNDKLAASEKIENSLTKGSLQSKMKFKPQHDISPEHRSAIRDWQRSDGGGREKIPEITGNARARALHVLSKRTQTRIHPETGEREFLLHRGMGQNEHELLQYNKGHKEKSSWTPDLEVANRFAKRYLIMDREGHQDQDTAPTEKRRVSAWIPESSIHHYLPMVGTTNPDLRMPNLYSEEHEVIVKPHKLNTVQFSMQRTNPLHEKINRKVAKQQHGFTKLAANENIESDLAKGSLQSRLKFNPRHKESVVPNAQWFYGSGDQEDRQSVPKIEGNARQRALHKLSGLTHVKIDPETGKRLFLLHRGISHSEAKKYVDREQGTANHHKSKDLKMSSWTPNHTIAYNFSNDPSGQNVISSYIHEDDIHSFPLQTGIEFKGKKEPLSRRLSNEKEVIVHHTQPHKLLDNNEAFKLALPFSNYRQDNSETVRPVMAEDGYFDEKDMASVHQKINERSLK